MWKPAYLLIFLALFDDVVEVSNALKCDRTPEGMSVLRSASDGRFKLRILGEPDRYIPGENYTSKQSISELWRMLAEFIFPLHFQNSKTIISESFYVIRPNYSLYSINQRLQQSPPVMMLSRFVTFMSFLSQPRRNFTRFPRPHAQVHWIFHNCREGHGRGKSSTSEE